MQPTQEQIAQAVRLKAYRPFRRVWIALPPEGSDEQPEIQATATLARAKRLTRLGWSVHLLN